MAEGSSGAAAASAAASAAPALSGPGVPAQFQGF
jgi:ubiquitin carboxyl-terminal hydrolase 14